MPTFREVLKKTIPSKTERLLEFIQRTAMPRLEKVGQRNRDVLNFLRDNQRIIGFTQPRSFDMREYQERTTRLFNRITSAISRFVRRIGNRSRLLSGSLSPSARQFRMALERTIERSRSTMIDAARDLLNRRITPSQFRETLTRQIRTLHLSASFTGIRSFSNTSVNVLEEVQARISKQLNFLDDFTQDIQEIFDKQSEFTPKQAERIVNSASKYADAARSTHSNAERLLVEDTYGTDVNDDRVLGMRILGPSESHCFVCFPAGTMILCKDGWRAIERITTETQVMTTNGLSGVKAMLERKPHDGLMILESGGNMIATTPDHPFMIESTGYLKAEDLLPSDKLMLYQDVPDGVCANFLSPNPFDFIPHTDSKILLPDITCDGHKLFLNKRFIPRMNIPPCTCCYQNLPSVYTLELEHTHNYIANGFIVSNCPDLASTWEELDQLVAIGDTPCGSSCKCHIIYARASEISGETLPVDTSSQVL